MKNPRILFSTVAIAFSGLLAGMSATLAQGNGGDIEAEATGTVKPAADGAPAPRLSLEPFPLGQVVLNPDEQQRATQFMKNRDKFVRGLASTDPDGFLHTFRNAFGQKQPKGARPLSGWDSQTTRLFRISGDRRFLECAKLFDNISFFFGDAEHSHGLARNVDTLRGKHANQHIPQITGALETYRNTHEAEYYRKRVSPIPVKLLEYPAHASALISGNMNRFETKLAEHPSGA